MFHFQSIPIVRKWLTQYNREIGAFVVNDISGGTFDTLIFDKVAGLHLPYILMHSKGKSDLMQNSPVYEDVVKEIILFFAAQLQKLKLLGVATSLLIPDLGLEKQQIIIMNC